LKIFVSYSRRDAGDFADQIQKYLSGFKYDVFTDVKSINVGDIWSIMIDDNISKCDIFIVIITYGSLQSVYVEKEVMRAQKENKKIIPCIQRDVDYDKIKWGLSSLQGIEFDEKYELARKIYTRIIRIQQNNLEVQSNNIMEVPSSLSSESKEEGLLYENISKPQEELSSSKTHLYSSSPIQTSSQSSKKEDDSTYFSDNLESKADNISKNRSAKEETIPTQTADHRTYVSDTGFETPPKINFKLLIPVSVAAIFGITIVLFVVFGSIITPSHAINHPPTVSDKSVTTTVSKPINITLNAADVDLSNTLKVAIVTSTSHGTLSPINQDTGNVTYTPKPGFTGIDSFTFKANDGKIDSSNTGTVRITVNNK
jgi:hypothetical protein